MSASSRSDEECLRQTTSRIMHWPGRAGVLQSTETHPPEGLPESPRSFQTEASSFLEEAESVGLSESQWAAMSPHESRSRSAPPRQGYGRPFGATRDFRFPSEPRNEPPGSWSDNDLKPADTSSNLVMVALEAIRWQFCPKSLAHPEHRTRATPLPVAPGRAAVR